MRTRKIPGISRIFRVFRDVSDFFWNVNSGNSEISDFVFQNLGAGGGGAAAGAKGLAEQIRAVFFVVVVGCAFCLLMTQGAEAAWRVSVPVDE